jgi:hypothetical protein
MPSSLHHLLNVHVQIANKMGNYNNNNKNEEIGNGTSLSPDRAFVAYVGTSTYTSYLNEIGVPSPEGL